MSDLFNDAHPLPPSNAKVIEWGKEVLWAEGYTDGVLGKSPSGNENQYLLGYKSGREFGQTASILPPDDQSLPGAR